MIDNDFYEERLIVDPMSLGPGMVCAPRRNGMAGTGDLRPMVYRPGSMDAFALPSRIGRELHFPDGSVGDVETVRHAAKDE